MFAAYRGFDVIVDAIDPKKNTTKSVEGKLVKRNEDFTVVNIRGRVKKFKNSEVNSVRLPKAKREKGVR